MQARKVSDMKRAFAFACAVLALGAFSSAAGASAATDFAGREASLAAARDEAATPVARANAARTLAKFYVEHELYVEALAAMEEIAPEVWRDADSLFMAQAEYALGRDRAVLAALDDERLARAPVGRALRAMALTRLGAYAGGAALFVEKSPAALWPALAAAYHLAYAEAAFETGARAVARAALGASESMAQTTGERRARRLLHARLAWAEAGDDAGLKAIVAQGVEPFAARASLDLLAAAHERGEINDRAALEEARRLSLRWDGGAATRESLAHLSVFAREEEPPTAFDALRRLTDLHPESDASVAARGQLTAMLIALGARDDLSASEMAQLFYENLEFAPPGRAGDALIRDVAARLAALDLLGPASELLNHQVFHRLRGAERARVAADLAELYLDDQRPSMALRTIRATRFSALDPALNERRRLIEAEALSHAVSGEAGLSLLEEMGSEKALLLRADIRWRERDWAGAGAAYREAFAAAVPFSVDTRRLALRTAAALLKAGDESGFRAFRKEVKQKLADTPEGALLDRLGADDGVDPAFMDLYRRAFDGAGAEG